MRIMVTRKENVTFFDDNGDFTLADEKEVGLLRQVHIINAQVVDPATGQVHIGAVLRAEVYWENKRSPAFTMEDPENLAWLTISGDKEEEDEAEETEEQEEFEDDEEMNVF